MLLGGEKNKIQADWINQFRSRNRTNCPFALVEFQTNGCRTVKLGRLSASLRAAKWVQWWLGSDGFCLELGFNTLTSYGSHKASTRGLQ